MKLSIRTLCAAAAAAGLLLTPAMAMSQASNAIRDARETAPAALLGVWKADVAASTYGSTPPREQLRIFQLSEEGRLMVIFLTLNAAGVQSGGHWSVGLNGEAGAEYHSSYGSTAYNMVTLTMRDARRFDMTVARGGEVNLTGGYVLSEDGSTLTYSYGEGPGATTILYRRWEALD